MSLKTFFKQALDNRAARNAQAKQSKQEYKEYHTSFRSLETAIYASNKEAIEMHLQAFLGKRDRHEPEHITPLLRAAIERRDAETFAKLYSGLNIDPNYKIHDKSDMAQEWIYPLLCSAAKEGAQDIVFFLLNQEGIDIDASVEYRYPEMGTSTLTSHNKTALNYCDEQKKTGMKEAYEALLARQVKITGNRVTYRVEASFSSGVTNHFPRM